MQPVFAQSMVEWASGAGSRIESALDDTWHALPPEIQDAPGWVWLLVGAIVALVVIKTAFR
jgi:hypothetical protein